MPSQAHLSRRAFLARSLSIASTAGTLPVLFEATARGAGPPSQHRGRREKDQRILLVIELSGGNDGLNTVVPVGDETYQRIRGPWALNEHAALPLPGATAIGLHPSLTGLQSLYQRGLVSIVQGVGHPDCSHSHYVSTHAWHSAEPGADSTTGWLGRYIDQLPRAASREAVAIGRRLPLMLRGNTDRTVVLPSGCVDQCLGKYWPSARKRDLDCRPNARFPSNALAQDLRMVVGLIQARVPARVYHVSMGGFDTHTNQSVRHAVLLQQLDESLKAFQEVLAATGDDRRVMTLIFSEFGRRVELNSSGGSEHGAAGPVFLIGPAVEPGLHGRQPSLTQLDPLGGLIHQVDFRQVYAAILKHWLGVDSVAVLGRHFEAMPLIRLPQRA
jgi:uncharacterized protein (DUF1501 family)